MTRSQEQTGSMEATSILTRRHDQAPVRAREGAPPRTREEHGAGEDPVRPVEPVDDSRKTASTGKVRQARPFAA
jgi:hypothetical protein